MPEIRTSAATSSRRSVNRVIGFLLIRSDLSRVCAASIVLTLGVAFWAGISSVVGYGALLLHRDLPGVMTFPSG